MSDDSRCVFRHDTPWDELQRIIDEDTRERLLLFLAQRLDDPDFSDSPPRADVGHRGAGYSHADPRGV